MKKTRITKRQLAIFATMYQKIADHKFSLLEKTKNEVEKRAIVGAYDGCLEFLLEYFGFDATSDDEYYFLCFAEKDLTTPQKGTE